VPATGLPAATITELNYARDASLTCKSVSSRYRLQIDRVCRGSLIGCIVQKPWHLIGHREHSAHCKTCWAQIVYDAIAGSGDFYKSPVDPAVRSLMNIPFTIPSKPELEKTFISEAAARGLVRCSASDASRHVIRLWLHAYSASVLWDLPTVSWVVMLRGCSSDCHCKADTHS